MSEKINPREVLSYLNELGYTNITALQLKEFIKDLKKVIKYDSRYGENTDVFTKQTSYIGEESNCYECSESCKENTNVRANVSNTSDKENQSVQPLKRHRDTGIVQKDKHIAVHIYDTKRGKYLNHEHCVHIDTQNLQSDNNKEINIGAISSSRPETTESTIHTIPPCSSREMNPSRASKASSKDRKSRVTFIRSSAQKPLINKSDPVALYHYYQSEWKKSKIPGQDNRDDLRWAIREKMLSGPKVEVKSKCNIPRCGWSR